MRRKERRTRPDATPTQTGDQDSRIRELEKRLTEAQAREAEAQEQQAATSELLKVIGRSTFDLQPVFETLAENAVRLCEAERAFVYRFDGQVLRSVADCNATVAMKDFVARNPITPGRQNGAARAALERRTVHIHDAQADPEFTYEARFIDPLRTVLAIPMLRADELLGVIVVYRFEVRPFSESHILLLETFADQAAIAIENVRLFTQTKEALERQTATGEILRVISSSPTDLRPVFDAIAASARRLCEALYSVVFRFDGEMLTLVADDGASPAQLDVIRSAYPAPPSRRSVAAQAILERRVIAIADAQSGIEYPHITERARAIGYRSIISVPMLRGDTAIGAINVLRVEAVPFTETQIELLKTFADQAVIAIEDVRLFTELHEKNEALTRAHAQMTEALEQQTATAEILRAIAASPTEIQPVLDTIARNAARVCNALDASLVLIDGDTIRIVARFGPLTTPIGLEIPLDRRSMPGRAVIDRQTLAVEDTRELLEAEYPLTREFSRRFGHRSAVATPLVRQGAAIGALFVRRAEVRAFTGSEIELLKTFADQAVIAIENVRLFNETRDALQQQTATSEILRVISRSPTNVQPVFEAIVASGVALFEGAAVAVVLPEDAQVRLAAIAEADPERAARWRERFPFPLTRDYMHAVALVDRRLVDVPDVLESDVAEPGRQNFLASGYRAITIIPMLREHTAIGAISVVRPSPGPLSEKQLALLKTFADQAVIAIENVRLFTELQEKNQALTQAHVQVTEALEQQTATSEILRVISRSPTDVQPVFDTIVVSAARLCEAQDVAMLLVEGDHLRLAAGLGPLYGSIASDFTLRLTRGSAATRAVIDRAIVHIHDFATESEEEYPVGRELARRFGHRSMLAVPLLREGVPIGVICAFRLEVRPFPEQQIALLRTFADQAVIAIENVRLFKALEARNKDLTEALEQQTATAEILSTIAQAQTDVQPVFDTIVRSAARLCRAVHAAVFVTDGRTVDAPANYGSVPEALAAARARFPRPLARDSTAGMAILTRAPVHVPDVEEPATPDFVRRSGQLLGFRSVVTVPMLHEGKAVGAILVARRETGRFPDAELQLLRTFADQAVIAVENVRLFKELEARTHDLTRSVGELRALGEVGQAISSTLDLRTVLSTIVARATHLSGTDAGVVYEYDELREIFLPRATEHLEADIVETMLATPVRKGEGATGRLAEIHEPNQVPDILLAPAESRVRGALVRAGYRALLAVPLVRENHLLGGLTVIRKAAGAFAPEVIELLRTFATQSALAIQNARLFLEIGDKSRQLEVASQHKSEFLANMSHELRTPLNAIIGFSEVLTERMFGELNDKQAEYLQDIHASGQHLLSLINDILDLSKIEAGRMELELKDFDLRQAISNAVTLVRERAGRRGIGVHHAVEERLGPIRGDERKVKQVLLNLLSNALKFTPEGGRVEVRAIVRAGMAEVSVTDTGVGIAPEDQEAVFEEFRQVGTADKKVEGTGLGLALSRKFIELHGGRIWVQSEVGGGSTFSFTLPLTIDHQRQTRP